MSACRLRWCPQAQFFSHKTSKHTFPAKKRYLWRSGWRSTVQGSRHTWTLKKYIVLNIVSFPPLNYSPSVLAVLLVVVLVVVLLLCCCPCLCLLCCRIANTATAATVGMPPLPPLPLVGEEDDACYTNADSSPATSAQAMPTAAPPRRRKLSAGRWNPARHWTGPSQPVVRVAKAATMMVAQVVVAEVGSRTRLVWSSPPPPEAAQRQRGQQASEGRGDGEGDCGSNEGGKQWRWQWQWWQEGWRRRWGCGQGTTRAMAAATTVAGNGEGNCDGDEGGKQQRG